MGGFTLSQEMMVGFSRDAYVSQPLGVPDLTGDGHRMAFTLGADAVNIDEVLGIPGLTLPGAVSATYALWSFMPDIAAIFVNKNGKRFVDEYKFYDWKNTELLHQPEAIAFSIFDDATRQSGAGRIVAGSSESLDQEVTDGTVFRADTIAGLASQIGAPAAALEATIAKWNEDVAAGVDTEWGRTTAMGPIATVPFYAFKTYSTTSDNSGGIKINTDAQVITTWGNVIPRLYAAGQVSGGVIGEHYPGSGTALNALVTFGRIAGAKVATETPLT
jgi:succinate dehydrogenase/fumarate reductase flavoprotein subunit